MGIAPEEVVDPPATTPPLHSLLSSAVVIKEPASSRWEAGFVFQPENCIEAEAWAPCGSPGEVDEIVVVAQGGTWSITFDGETTTPLDFNAPAGAVQFALEQLSNIAPGDVTVTATTVAGITTYLLSWDGVYNGLPIGTALLSVTDISLTLGDASGTVTLNAPFIEVGAKVTKKAYDGFQAPQTYMPYVIETPYTCSSFGFKAANYEERARRQLEANKHKALEYEFWTGNINPSNISLVRGTPNDDLHVLNPGGAAAPTAVSPSMALVMLEQALANCGSGGRGLIHATTGLVERWSGLYVVSPMDEFPIPVEMITTRSRGDIVVNGSGYPGTGPLGQPPPGPGETWAYATGMVNIRMGQTEIYPKEMKEALDRRTNTVTYRGEVVASAVHDGCCSFAVLVDVGAA